VHILDGHNWHAAVSLGVPLLHRDVVCCGHACLSSDWNGG